MKMLLLLSAVALLAGSALTFPAGTRNNLNHIIDLINSTNTTLNEHTYVEKVAHAGCRDEFFCKVHHILQNNTAFQANAAGAKIVRNLAMYLNGTQVNCPVVPEKRTIEVEIPLGDFLASLKTCIQNKNLGRGTAPMKTVG